VSRALTELKAREAFQAATVKILEDLALIQRAAWGGTLPRSPIDVLVSLFDDGFAQAIAAVEHYIRTGEITKLDPDLLDPKIFGRVRMPILHFVSEVGKRLMAQTPDVRLKICGRRVRVWRQISESAALPKSRQQKKIGRKKSAPRKLGVLKS